MAVFSTPFTGIFPAMEYGFSCSKHLARYLNAVYCRSLPVLDSDKQITPNQ